jgi:hypothetical protein
VSCPDTKFQADFFNNVAAVAMVLIFAKVVTHRSHVADPKSKRPTPRGALLRACWHTLGVSGAAVAVIAALWATEDGTDKCAFHYTAWVGLGVAGVVFLVEIVIDDVGPPLRRWLQRDSAAT